jgi:hypothetical protein
MRAFVPSCLLLAPLAVATPLVAQAPAWPIAGAKVIALPEGPTALDLLGSGRLGLVVRGYRNNYNAHSFHVLTFYVTYPDSESGAPHWDIVPFTTGADYQLTFSTTQGADCVLRDLRLLKPARSVPSAMILVVGERAFGESYAAAAPVTFSLYELATNTDMSPGEPGIYFARTASFQSRGTYCDVDEAFAKELGIPTEGSATGRSN